MKIDTDTDEGKAELQKLIDAETKGLKDKTAELLGSLKKLKEDMKASQDRLDEIQREKEEAEEAAASKKGDVEKIKETLTAKHQKEIEKLNTELTDKSGKLHKLVVDQGLTDALVKAGIAPQYMDAARALIKSTTKAEISEKDGNAIAQIDGKELTEFVTSWAQGDSGKHFVAAGNNGGGGSNGSNGGSKGAGAKTMKRSEFEALPPADKVTFSKDGGKLTD